MEQSNKKNIQKKVFLDSEADNWYTRNKDKILERKDFYPQFRGYEEFLSSLKNTNILEIGSSVGHNLDYIDRLTGSSNGLYAIEPSRLAVEDGEKLFPKISFTNASGEELQCFEDNKFDFIIIGFCLYLFDREILDLFVNEVDRVLKKDGFLMIFDFDSKTPFKNKYAHEEGIYSYKMDYSTLFLENRNYYLVQKMPWSHRMPNFDHDKNERCATYLIYKELS